MPEHTPATLHDCLVAFSILDSGLPPGDTIVQWQNHLQPGQKWVLPYTWTYGESAEDLSFRKKNNFDQWKETCQMQLQAAGKSQEELAEVPFSADAVRQMAGYLIDQCVGGKDLGGFITKDLARTIDFVTAPRTKYDDPFRRPPTVESTVSSRRAILLTKTSIRHNILHPPCLERRLP